VLLVGPTFARQYWDKAHWYLYARAVWSEEPLARLAPTWACLIIASASIVEGSVDDVRDNQALLYVQPARRNARAAVL
jgi:hypothetical protein